MSNKWNGIGERVEKEGMLDFRLGLFWRISWREREEERYKIYLIVGWYGRVRRARGRGMMGEGSKRHFIKENCAWEIN